MGPKGIPKGSGSLSLEQRHPSMGKMPLRSQHRRRGGDARAVESGAELQQLLLRQGQKEALQKDDGLAEASVKVVMRRVQQVPFPLGLHGGRVVQLFRGIREAFGEILYEFQQGRDLVKKLRALTQEYPAADSIEAGGSAALGLLKILGIEGAEMRDDAEMLGVSKHRAQQKH